MTTTSLDFLGFDADNHYYEPEDAFTRHLPAELRRRTMQWANVDGKRRLLVAGRINRFIPNPTFDPVAKPGSLDQYFRGRNPRGLDTKDLFGELEPIRPEYRDRDARLAVMDRQGLQGAFFFPTLGVGMEQALLEDRAGAVAAFRAFNLWLDEDWGYNYKERIFAAPYISMLDVSAAVGELQRVLDRGARVVLMPVGPISTAAGGRSPGAEDYDRFWALVNESGVTVAVHAGENVYSRYLQEWGRSPHLQAFRQDPLRALLSPTPIHDTVASLLADKVFYRFPNVRLATVETGSDWVFQLFGKLKKAWGQTPHMFPEDPRETFRRHVWVSPFYEDDLAGLKELIGAERILMGSDWPHAEGLAEPMTYVNDLRRDGYSDEEIRLVMRENALGLSRPAGSTVAATALGSGSPTRGAGA